METRDRAHHDRTVERCGALEVVNLPLPPGRYTFYLAVDDQVNGQPDPMLMDAVEVEAE